jgi:BRCT domain type II-containing protein
MSEPDSSSPIDSSIVNKVIDDVITPVVTSDSPKPVEQKKEEEALKNSGSSNSASAEPSSSSASTSVASQETEKISTQLENMTIFGNKSLEELHRIQANRSHLSAGILFTDPNLRM